MSGEPMSNWLANLKVGDRVIVSLGWDTLVVDSVDSLTRTQIITRSHGRYRKKDGQKVGGYSSCLRPITEDALEEIEAKQLVGDLGALRRSDFTKLSIDTLRQAHQLLCGEHPDQ